MSRRNGAAPGALPPIRLGRFTIGDGRPCVIIAEAACEHKGRLADAKKLACAAKDAGADIVKFQLHLPRQEMVPRSVRFWAGSMDDVLEQVNLSVDDHRRLMRYCRDLGIQYLCTVYCAAGLDVLQQLGVDAFKIGSGEMTNLPMIHKAAQLSSSTGKPVLVSTGMSTMEEIRQTVAGLRAGRARFVLLNCTSEYPPKYAHLNLGLIRVLRDRFKVLVGHSDHSPEIWSALGAVALGARVIEKHFTLARRLKGPDHHVSLEPRELRTMIQAIRKLEAALGSDKRVHPEEEPVRRWAHHSVTSLCEIPAGRVITSSMIGVRRPGWGIPAKDVEACVGLVARRRIPVDAVLQWQDVRRTRNR